MNCPEETIWIELSLGTHDTETATALRDHADNCTTCAARKTAADHEHDLLNTWHRTVIAEHQSQQPIDALNGQSMTNIRLADAARTSQPWRQPLTLLAPAACIAIVAFLAFGTSRSIAFADVQKALANAKSVVCRFRANVDANQSDGDLPYSILTISPTHGVRQDHYVDGEKSGTTFTPRIGPIISTTPTDTYVITRQDAADDASPSRPMAWLNDLRTIAANNVSDATDDTIDNQPALRFDVTTLGGTLWVAPDTLLPIRYVTGPKAVHRHARSTIYDQFDWNPNIPDDHFATPNLDDAHHTIQPSFDLDGFIDSLRFFATQTGGTFPASLNCDAVDTEMSKLTDYFGPFTEDGTYKARTQQASMYLGTTCLFFKKLEQTDANPEYHGHNVNTATPDALLMTWKNEDGTRTEVNADLSVTVIDD